MSKPLTHNGLSKSFINHRHSSLSLRDVHDANARPKRNEFGVAGSQCAAESGAAGQSHANELVVRRWIVGELFAAAWIWRPLGRVE